MGEHPSEFKSKLVQSVIFEKSRNRQNQGRVRIEMRVVPHRVSH